VANTPSTTRRARSSFSFAQGAIRLVYRVFDLSVVFQAHELLLSVRAANDQGRCCVDLIRLGSGLAVVGVELAVDVLDVGLDGALGDEQFLSYLPIGPTGGYEGQHLALAQGLGKLCTSRRCVAGTVAFDRRQEFPEVVGQDLRCESTVRSEGSG
jgi:hypothetical protein